MSINSVQDSSNSTQNVSRRSANYHPSIWGDRFLISMNNSLGIDVTTQQQIEELKQKVRVMLANPSHNSPQKLQFIDSIQRLGLSYHFEAEIEDALEINYHDAQMDNDITDLSSVSLRFRLLRQHGFKATCEIFNQFKDETGNFRESLLIDPKGMLEFYEATQLRVRGENILEEALAFTTTNLKEMETKLSYPLSVQVSDALKQPAHKGLARVEARKFIFSYQQDCSHNKDLLKLAKLDFNLLQSMHKQELSEISKWWKDLNFAKGLPFARDRIVECYFWILSVYFEPQFSFGRRFLTKVIALTSIIDDVYDVYGTLEELTLLTEAIKRWDINNAHQLPDYMKLLFTTLLNVYIEMEEELAKEGKEYRVQYAKAAMKQLVQAYFEEAKWLHEGYIPTLEEYMRVALVSGAYIMLITTSFVGMGDVATKEAFDWVSTNPTIVTAASTICRLMDDIVSHKFEQERGHCASVVECYIRQYGGTEEEVYNIFRPQIENAWKDINQEFLRPTSVPMPLLMRALNFARVIDVLYKDGDNYTHVGQVTKDGIASLLIDPIPI